MKRKAFIEKTAKALFELCAVVAIFAVCAITIYMFMKGAPALKEVGVFDLLFKTIWKPTASEPSYGIGFIILASVVGTTTALFLGVPIGLLAAVYISEMAGKTTGNIVRTAIELLAAIPSVIYGLIGMMVLNPIMFRFEQIIFEDDSSHQFTGGANMLSAIIVLTIMILPTVISVSTSSLKAVPDTLRAASLALGATKEQTIFKAVIPAAKSGILTGVVLGTGRALGEAMAITMVAGGAVNIPLPFNSVRTLTTQIVSEMIKEPRIISPEGLANMLSELIRIIEGNIRMRSKFDEQLLELNHKMIEMGNNIISSIQKAIEALVARDIDQAKLIMDGDAEIDHLQKVIESICFNLLIQQQPVARDLRTVTAAMKMVTDMERIGDHAADISEMTILMGQNSRIDKFNHISEMASETMIMLNHSIEAYVEKDVVKAREVIEHDDIVDELFVKAKKDVIQLILNNPEEGEEAADILMIAKYFERIGDHATNIAEWVIYSLKQKENEDEV